MKKSNQRPVQEFSKEYLERCKEMTIAQRLEFVDSFQKLMTSTRPSKSKLISMKVPEDLLEVFKARAELEGQPYQTLIKKLMRDWLDKEPE